MKYLSNAFSLGMLKDGFPLISRMNEADLVNNVVRWDEDVNHMVLMVKSVVGHENTASLLSGILKAEVFFNRESVSLNIGDVLYVAQYVGDRLPEGATVLPENARIEFWKVYVSKDDPSVNTQIMSDFRNAHYHEEAGTPDALLSVARKHFGTIDAEDFE